MIREVDAQVGLDRFDDLRDDGWKRVPALTIVSSPGDPRIPAVREAVAFWNQTFAELGRRYRLPTRDISRGYPPTTAAVPRTVLPPSEKQQHLNPPPHPRRQGRPSSPHPLELGPVLRREPQPFESRSGLHPTL